jgi:acetylornithine deacetylase
MKNEKLNILYEEAVVLLKELIATPSFSKEEDKTATILTDFLTSKKISYTRVGNNVFACTRQYDEDKPTILLNSHHDTVKPNSQYKRDPFLPSVEDGKLFGLGSNDAGGCLVSLISTFLYFYEQSNLKYNIVIAATAEEEISGSGGVEYVLPYLPKIDFAIVGEPTLLQMAVAERGLLVLDCTTHGKAGHAGRDEGENAVYKALKDIEWIKTYEFSKNSELLGRSKMTVTVIETDNKAHNVVPPSCKFVIDVRLNELYTFEEVLETIKTNIQSEIKPRSFRLRSTSIELDHPLVKAGLKLKKSYYGSPTTSDKALMHFPALKIGPGDSARSHMADEYIYVKEIKEGIELYIKLLQDIV